MSGTTCCIFFNIMNDTTFSCSHFYSHSFLSAGKQSEMSKRSQESSSLDSPMADSQVWQWEERNEKSGWYSVQYASGNRECSSEDSGGLAETHASGNREYTRKVVQNIKDQDTMKASRKYLGRCTFRYGRDLWLHRCRQHCPESRE